MKKQLLNSKEEWLAIKNEPRGYWKEAFKDNYRAVEDSDDLEPWPEPDPLSYPCIVIYEEVLARVAYGEHYYEWHWRFVYPEDFMPKCRGTGSVTTSEKEE